MATYANNLRLTEIVTGDESGTWGTTTNNNWEFTTAAIGYGVKSMASDADVTYTMPDGTVDTIRSLYLKVTSGVSLTATRTITIGPNTISKVWVIENATTGAQSIIIKQGSGATVTITNGSKVMLYTDGAGIGAAVVNANPTASTSGTVTSVAATVPSFLSVSGSPVTSSGTLAFTYSGTALPVLNGGTGVTTSTGSGNVVLSTSPTLVTPVLGTPTSGNLQNCTINGTDLVGFLSIPQNSQSAAYTLVLADSGKHIYHPASDANARTYTIPANSSVAYPIGTAVTFINMTSQVVTIAITTDTMYLSSAGTTGSRSLAQYGSATAIKMTSTTWLISGSGLT